MNMKKKDPESTEMTFFEHIDALRPHLVRGVMAIGVIGLVAFFCKSFIIDTVLFGPQSPDFPTNRMLTWVGAQWAHMAEWLNSVLGTSFDTDPETFRIANDRFSIINTSLSGQFNLHMKISLLTGLAMAMPYTLWEFWRFVRPALTPKEIQGTHLFVFWVSLCFFGGLLFGYFVMAPLSINFFANYQASEFITNMFDISDYLTTVIIGRRLKSFVFTTDLAIIRNCDADAVFAVYPFTPQQAISDAIIKASYIPVFCGVGGGTTHGVRTLNLARDVESQGAMGVVLNSPISDLNLLAVSRVVDIPVIITVTKADTDIRARLESGASILNVACSTDTPRIVKKIRDAFPDVPIIASGGKTGESISATIAAGANAITYTPPTSAELFSESMRKYRGRFA